MGKQHAFWRRGGGSFTGHFLTDMPLLCRYRTEVREQYGVKIYFDPVSTAAREQDAKSLAKQVCADQSRSDDINTVRACSSDFSASSGSLLSDLLMADRWRADRWERLSTT